MTNPVSRLVCAGCGASPPQGAAYPFRCPNADAGDGVDHVLRRELDLAQVAFPSPQDGDESPFVRYRTLLHAYHAGRAGGLSDADLVALIRELDARVAGVDGHGFRVTPFARSDGLSDALGFSAAGGVWVKDETGNVSGSHKARHLFGVLLWLEVAEHLGLARGARRDLAIASCGNAALAAAVVAAAGGRTLRVFVPVDADEIVLGRLDDLGADVTVCPRTAAAGDPTVHALRDALAGGALPFTCQGDLNGLAVEGGETLGWEIASSGVPVDRIVVQVGGGALASAVVHAFREAHELGAIEAAPRIDTVQTHGAWPLKRAYDAVVDRGGRTALHYAVQHRGEFMWPWEIAPRSIAHGILDDETYDWFAVVEGMIKSRGTPVVVGEQVLEEANALARQTTEIAVDPTGSSGLAGLIALRELDHVRDDERIALLFTGVDRTIKTDSKGARHEELPRARHPVA